MINFELFREKGFQLEGEFLGFIEESLGKPKYLRVAVPGRELQIKLSKELRKDFSTLLQDNRTPSTPQKGDRIQVLGKKKFKKDWGELKLKAEELIQLSCNLETKAPSLKKPDVAESEILVCQKSSCLKRGGKDFCQELEEALDTLGLQNQVKIKQTGCQKLCKKAPVITLMPGRTTYSQISSNALVGILKKHFLDS